MKNSKGLKKGILIAVLCVLVFGLALFIFIRIYSKDRVGEQLSLGEKYLNASDYNAAILAYQQALEIEPANTAAIVGLAQAYNAIGDSDFALELLEQLGGESRDPAVQEMEAAIHEENGNIDEAIQIIDKLIDMIDDDEYYGELEELVERKLSGLRLYGNSGGHEAVISDGLKTRGLNVTGQLGTSQGLNRTDYVQSQFRDADFDGTAAKVYCIGQNTYVIDDEGNLWVAGTNRSGQEASGSSTAVTESGWRQVQNISDVAHVTGGSGYVVALKTDGTLWYAGQNFGHTGESRLWNPEFVRISSLGTVVQVEANDYALYALNTSGELYRSYHTSSLSDAAWYCIGKEVKTFSTTDSDVYWVNRDGWIVGEIGRLVNIPSNWQTDYDGYVTATMPTISVKSMATNWNGILFLDTDGKLYYLGSAGLTLVDESGLVEAVYRESEYLVAQWSDGRIQLWDTDGNTSEIN